VGGCGIDASISGQIVGSREHGSKTFDSIKGEEYMLNKPIVVGAFENVKSPVTVQNCLLGYTAV
jgi:hypothetical protein